MPVAPLEAEVEFLAHKVRTVVRELGTDQPTAFVFTSFRAFSRDGFLVNLSTDKEGITTTSVQYKARMVLTHHSQRQKSEYVPGEWEQRLDEFYEQAIRPKVVKTSTDPSCTHPEVSYMDIPFDGQRFDCTKCGYAERMPYAPGRKIIFPANATVSSSNGYIDHADEHGVVK